MLNTATLPLLLKQLGLPSMCANWEEQANNAQEQNWTYAQYLTVLSDQEAADRKQKRIPPRIPSGSVIKAIVN